MALSDTGRHVVSVGSIRFGEDPFVVVAGPGPGLASDQLAKVAAMVAGTRAAMVRCGSTVLALDEIVSAASHARQEQLPTVARVNNSLPFEAACEALDMVEVDAGSLLDDEWVGVIRRSRRPIMLRLDSTTTFDDWLAVGASLCDDGREVVLVCEDPDGALLARALDRSSLPILVDALSEDPDASTAVLRARANGAHGVVVGLAPDAENSPGALDQSAWSGLVFALEVLRTRGAIDRVDREIVRLLGERQQLSLDIGRAKADRGLPVLAPEREIELIDALRSLGPEHGLSPDHIEAVFQLILAESRSIQEQRRNPDR